MFETKRNLKLLFWFLGLKYPENRKLFGENKSVTIGNQNELPVSRFSFEEFKEKMFKSLSEMNKNQYELDKKLEKLIRFLNITEEDYVDEDSFGNKSIQKRFVKRQPSFSEEALITAEKLFKKSRKKK